MCNLFRDGIACREKWMNVLDPTLNRGPFSTEEDDTILRLCEEVGNDDSMDNKFWSRIAKKFPDRTDNQIYRRWKQLSGQQNLLNL